MKKFFKYLLSLFLLFSVVGCSTQSENHNPNNDNNNSETIKPDVKPDDNTSSDEYVTDTFEGITYKVYKDEPYNSKYEVAIYIHYYHELPKNYYTKSEASKQNFGKNWTPENKLSVGGNHFGNREGLLPDGVSYTECDIDSIRTNRGAKRIVFSNTFKVYYTGDHYRSFEEIY